MFWNQELECISRGDLESLQLTGLKDQIARAQKSAFYGKLLREAGLDQEDIRSIDDIRKFPFTTKEDLRAGFPYGMIAVPHEELVRVHVSSGTTGTATAVYHTWNDVQVWADSMARCLYMAGMRKSDVFQNMTGYGLFTGGLGLHYGAEKLGALVIPAGTGNSKRQITLMRDFGTTVIHIIPSYALKLIQTFEEMGVDPREDTSLRIAVIGAEPHSEETRRRIEEVYGVFAVNSYGLSEMNGPGVAFECPHKTGLHLWEDRYLLEIVDPVSLEPCAEGEVGEIVMTTLNREAMPLLRYRTRDLASLIPEPCPCGRGHRMLSRILGRTDDMFIVKGVNIYPMQIERVLMGFEESGNNYRIILEKKGPEDQIHVQLELSEKANALASEEKEGLRGKLVESLRDEILVTPLVELLSEGSIPASEGKAQRVLDARDGRPIG